MKKLIFILGLLSFSCSPTTEKEKEQTFVAINLQTLEEDFKEKYKNLPADEIPPPPPIVYYSKHNLIIDDEGELYYFLRKDKAYRYCGTGLDNQKPELLNLLPSELVKIPEDSITNFVKKVRPEYGKLFFSFSSVRDTFKSHELTRLIKLYDKDQSLTAYTLRTATAEEKVVLKYKKSGKPYDPEKIKWNPADFHVAETLKKVR